MGMNRLGITFFVLLAVLFEAPSSLAAEDATGRGPIGAETAREILHRAYTNLYAEDYIQELELASSFRGGQEMSRTLQITRRQSVRPGKALFRFTKPQKIRRASVLILEHQDLSDELFLYLPALKKTKRLSSSQRADAFFGTDLSYEDVEPKHVDDFDVDSVGMDEYRGIACERIEQRARPPFESQYERMVSCVERERGVILWIDYYRRGEVAKRLEIDPAQVRPVGDRFIPYEITLTTPSRRSQTRVVTLSYEIRNDIPDEIFSTWNLESGTAPRDRRRAGTPEPATR